jgi:hypothetical protein
MGLKSNTREENLQELSSGNLTLDARVPQFIVLNRILEKSGV